MRLLLVEDHAELAEWVARSLRQGGFVLEVLHRGDHADQINEKYFNYTVLIEILRLALISILKMQKGNI